MKNKNLIKTLKCIVLIIIGLLGISCILYVEIMEIFINHNVKKYNFDSIDFMFLINIPLFIWYIVHYIRFLPTKKSHDYNYNAIYNNIKESGTKRTETVFKDNKFCFNNKIQIVLLLMFCVIALFICCIDLVLFTIISWFAQTILFWLTIILGSLIGIIATVKLFIVCVKKIIALVKSS